MISFFVTFAKELWEAARENRFKLVQNNIGTTGLFTTTVPLSESNRVLAT